MLWFKHGPIWKSFLLRLELGLKDKSTNRTQPYYSSVMAGTHSFIHSVNLPLLSQRGYFSRVPTRSIGSRTSHANCITYPSVWHVENYTVWGESKNTSEKGVTPAARPASSLVVRSPLPKTCPPTHPLELAFRVGIKTSFFILRGPCFGL